MRLCDVVHGIYGGNSPPNTDARLLFAWYACVYPDEYTRRKKRMRSQEGERCKSALKHRRKSSYRLVCFSLWYCYLFNSRGQEAKQRRGCAEMFSAQLRWNSRKMSSSIRPRCEKQRVISKNDFRESVTSTDHCVHFKLRLMINLKSFSTSVWFPQTSRGYLQLQVLEESGWKMQMCHWLCTRVPVKEQLIVKDTLWSFPVNKHVALSPAVRTTEANVFLVLFSLLFLYILLVFYSRQLSVGAVLWR